jgi:phospholipid/cholesterol/gamma-HCH transport system substrate-binding protein
MPNAVPLGFLGYAIAHSGQTGISGNGYPLYARFSSIAGLNIGSDVRMAGVKIDVVDSASIDPKTYLPEARRVVSGYCTRHA